MLLIDIKEMNSLYKTLAKSMRQYIKPSILTMIFLAGEVFAEMMIPYLMAKVLDRGFETKDIQYIIQIGLLMAVIALISMMFTSLPSPDAGTASNVSVPGSKRWARLS